MVTCQDKALQAGYTFAFAEAFINKLQRKIISWFICPLYRFKVNYSQLLPIDYKTCSKLLASAVDWLRFGINYLLIIIFICCQTKDFI